MTEAATVTHPRGQERTCPLSALPSACDQALPEHVVRKGKDEVNLLRDDVIL